MNKLHAIKKLAPRCDDDHRPAREFWGPAAGADGQVCGDYELVRDIRQPLPERCPVCSHRALSFVANVYGWPVHECRRCGAGFVWPQPAPEFLQRLYTSGYWSTYLGSDEPLYCRPNWAYEFKRYGECVDRIIGGNRAARILDVGAGDGTMLRTLADAGYLAATGIELSQENAHRARKRLGVEVLAREFMDFQESGWHAIILWAVVEHLADPLSYLRHAKTLLTPGGLCILMTGDNSSLHARIQGVFDYWVYPPEHLFFFTTRSLHWLFREAGFSGFAWRLQFQPAWKESLLWTHRFLRAVVAWQRPGRRFWRSDLSNCLVAWGANKR